MMEDILYDLGLSRYSEILRAKNVTISTFKAMIHSSVNKQMMGEAIMQDCGLNCGQIIAITTKVSEILENHNQMNQNQQYNKSPLTPTLPYAQKAPNQSRRALLL